MRIRGLQSILLESIDMVERCRTDVELRACIIHQSSLMIKETLKIEKSRSLYPDELRLLSKSAGWMDLYFNKDGSMR